MRPCGPLIVCYHGVGRNGPGARCMISPAQLSAQLRILAAICNPVRLDDIRAWIERGEPLPRRSVLVTFDDGYLNNLENAVPLCRRLGLFAVLAIPTGYVGSDRLLWPDEIRRAVTDWVGDEFPLPADRDTRLRTVGRHRKRFAEEVVERCKRLPWHIRNRYLRTLRAAAGAIAPSHPDRHFLSWDDLRSIRQQGMDIASHTVNHEILSTLPEDALAFELTASKRVLEENLGTSCNTIVYPNGGDRDISPEVVREARRAGYAIGMTLQGHARPWNGDPLQLDRIDLSGRGSNRRFIRAMSGVLRAA